MNEGLIVSVVLASLAMIVMWLMASTSSSSTAGLVYIYAWFLGMPAATLATILRLRRQPPPPKPEDADSQ